MEAVIDALNNNGIALIQKCHESDTGVNVETLLLHESGESLSCGVLHVPASKQDGREFLGVKEDDFLVVMNAANKANKSIHRKAFAEAFMAFAMFRQTHPNAYLYVHTEPRCKRW